MIADEEIGEKGIAYGGIFYESETVKSFIILK